MNSQVSYRILFRLDAASFLGFGHLYQSLSLAEEWESRGGMVWFAMKEYEPEVMSWISSHGIEVVPLPLKAAEHDELEILIPFIKKTSIQCVIIDHHTLGYDYCSRLRKENIFTAIIDDEGTRTFCCDLLINYNIYAPYLKFKVAPHTKCLVGPEYAILRKQFLDDVIREKSGSKLLVTMGGGYARGEVIKVLQALDSLGDDTVRRLTPQIILGAGYPKPEKVIKDYGYLPVRFHYNIDDMRSIMEKSDFAISGGGGTLYELSRMGLPSIIIVLDENQKLIAHYFENSGISKNLGWYEDVTVSIIAEAIKSWINSPEELKIRGEKAACLIDGKGTIRIIDEIIRWINSGNTD